MPPASSIRSLAARALYEVGTLAGPLPSVVLPVARWRGHGEAVGPNTDVVIEGYPRSANSFAVAAFRQAQHGPVRIAHHVHAPANAIAGVRHGLPTLVLVRDPAEAAMDLVLAKRALTIRQALRGWIRFYRPLLSHRGWFIVSTSEEALSDFASVTHRLNARFGTSFAEFEGGDEASDEARRAAGEYFEDRVGPGLPLVGRTSAPTGAASEARERLRREYESPKLARLRHRAERLHRTFTGSLAR
jgi:hypothetical protein